LEGHKVVYHNLLKPLGLCVFTVMCFVVTSCTEINVELLLLSIHLVITEDYLLVEYHMGAFTYLQNC